MTTQKRSKLVSELKRRFRSPAALLAHLGLDQDLLAPASGGGGSNDPLQKMRTSIELLIPKLGLGEKEVALLLEMLDAEAPMDKLPDDHPQAGRARELAASDDDNLENVERFRAALRNAGMADADIETALAMITRQGEAIGDKLPVSALFGGLGGRRSGNFRSPSMAGDRAYHERFPSAVIVGIPYGPARPQTRGTAWPSSLDDYNKRFGGEHIGTNG